MSLIQLIILLIVFPTVRASSCLHINTDYFAPGRDYVYPGEFKNNISICSVVLPEGFTKISMYSFEGCSNLLNFTFPESLVEIATTAFTQCKIEIFHFKKNLQKISYSAIEGCNYIKEIHLPKNFKFYALGAITSNVGKFILEDDSTYFVYKNGLLLDKNERIVYKCTDEAKNVVLSDSIETVEIYAFQRANIQSFDSGKNCKFIGVSFFESTIETLKIGKSVQFLDGAGFGRCQKLTTIIIDPENAYYTVDSSFSIIYDINKTKLILYSLGQMQSTFLIPDSLETISDDSLSEITALKEFAVSQTNKNFKTFDGVLYKDNGRILYMCPCSKTTISIPSNFQIEEIGKYAFSNSRIQDISNIIPKSIKKIGKAAFLRNGYIKYFDASNIESLAESAFAQSSLQSITFGNNMHIKVLPDGVFRYSKLEKIEIPKNVKVIDKFSLSMITTLKTVVFNEGLEIIGSRAFIGDTNLLDFSFPESLLYVNDSAFDSCSALTKVIFPHNVISVGEYSFSTANNLRNVTVLNCFTKVAKNAFAYCTYESSLKYCQATDSFTQAHHFNIKRRRFELVHLVFGFLLGFNEF